MFYRRSLYDVNLVVLFLDAIYLPVRRSGPKESVICAWGITETGARELVCMRLGARCVSRRRSSFIACQDMGLNDDPGRGAAEAASSGGIAGQRGPRLVHATEIDPPEDDPQPTQPQGKPCKYAALHEWAVLGSNQ